MRTTPTVVRTRSPYRAGGVAGGGVGADVAGAPVCEGGDAEIGVEDCAGWADTAGFPADESQDGAFLVPQPLRARLAGSGVVGVLMRIA